MENHTVHWAAEITMNLAYEVGGPIAVGLAVLGHQVADVDLLRLGGANRGGDSLDEQVGQDAGVQVARTDHDHIGALDGADRLLAWNGVAFQIDAPDGRQRYAGMVAAGVNIRLATDLVAIRQFGAQGDTRKRDRPDAASGIEQRLRIFDGVQQIALVDALQGGDDEVAQIVPADTRRLLLSIALGVDGGHRAAVDLVRPVRKGALREAEVEDIAPQPAIARESDKRLAQIAQRQHAKLVHQPARTSPAISHRDNRAD